MSWPRCPEPCGKARFPAEHQAVLAAISVAMRKGQAQRPYRSDTCGCWHLSGRAGGGFARKIRQFTRPA